MKTVIASMLSPAAPHRYRFPVGASSSARHVIAISPVTELTVSSPSARPPVEQPFEGEDDTRRIPSGTRGRVSLSGHGWYFDASGSGDAVRGMGRIAFAASWHYTCALDGTIELTLVDPDQPATFSHQGATKVGPLGTRYLVEMAPEVATLAGKTIGVVNLCFRAESDDGIGRLQLRLTLEPFTP